MEKKCWMCGRTPKELRQTQIEQESYKDDELFFEMAFKSEYENEDYKYQHGLLQEGKSIYLCGICNAIIQIVMERDLKGYSVSGEINELKLERD